jgi:hypothetical protein
VVQSLRRCRLTAGRCRAGALPSALQAQRCLPRQSPVGYQPSVGLVRKMQLVGMERAVWSVIWAWWAWGSNGAGREVRRCTGAHSARPSYSHSCLVPSSRYLCVGATVPRCVMVDSSSSESEDSPTSCDHALGKCWDYGILSPVAVAPRRVQLSGSLDQRALELLFAHAPPTGPRGSGQVVQLSNEGLTHPVKGRPPLSPRAPTAHRCPFPAEEGEDPNPTHGGVFVGIGHGINVSPCVSRAC